MAVTPNYSWPVPVATDYVKDGWEAISDLGNAIDTTVAGLGSGLKLIKTQTIGSAVSSVSVTSAFSATYDNYKIIVSGGTVGGDYLAIALGASTASYSSGGTLSSFTSTGQSGVNTNAGAKMLYMGYLGNPHSSVIDVFGPYAANYTYFTANFSGPTASGRSGGYHGVAASYTDFTISANSGGNITGGTIYVYGYQKA